MAGGTGIVPRLLRDRLPSGVSLTATDLNEAMVGYAARKFSPEEAVEWRQADAANLPFDDESFEAVICQFGLMFVPDKEQALREAYRVLKPHGALLFNVWDAIEQNDFANVAHATISKFFEHNPPTFYEVPFSLHEPEADENYHAARLYESVRLQTARVSRLRLSLSAVRLSVDARGL